MFTLDAIRREANESSFHKGKLYYMNDRVKEFAAHKKENNKYEIHAVVRGTDLFQTFLALDVYENVLLEWNCSCPYHFGGICKHLVAAAMYFYHNGIEPVEQAMEEVPSAGELPETILPTNVPISVADIDKNMLKQNSRTSEVLSESEEIVNEGEISRVMNSKLKSMIIDDLGLSVLKRYGACDPLGRLVFIFDQFNLDNSYQNGKCTDHLQAARSRRVSLRIVRTHKDMEAPEELEKASGIKVDRGSIQEISGNYALLLEYITSNGVYLDGLYYIGQMNIDAIFAISMGIDKIYYGHPPCKLEFTQEQYRPEVKLSSRNDGSVLFSFGEEMTIIPGKYNTFILKDGKIMKLHEDIPYSFIDKIEKKPFVGPGLRKTFVASVLPMLKDVVDIKGMESDGLETVKMKAVVNENVLPEINIYVKYSKDADEVYILPEIVYGDYLTVNPFDMEEIDDYANFYYSAPKMSMLESIELDDCLLQFKRDIFKEHAVYSTLIQSGYLEPDEYGRLLVVGDEAFYNLFTEIIPDFPEDWKVFYDKEIEKIKFKREEVSFDFDFLANIDNGLLEFDLEFHCKNLKIKVDQLNDYIMQNKKLLNIDGSFIEITNREVLQKLFALLEKFKGRGKHKKYSGKLFNASELDSILSDEEKKCSYKCNEEFKSLMHEMKSGMLIEKVKIPERFSNIMRDYQKDGVQWACFLRKYGFGGILADDMGLGKTLQALAALSMQPSGTTSLIVCPKTLIHNWYNEIQKFAPGLKTLIACGGAVERLYRIRNADGFDLIITSYPLLQKDIAVYSEKEFEYCIIDEAQYIKNASTRTARCVKTVKSRYRLALTGTPMENSVMDLWSLFDFVMPGFLGNEASFKARYANALPGEGSGVLTSLNRKTKPFLLRRTKKEMLKDLPPKIEQVGLSELTTAQLALYTKMLEKIRGELFDTVAAKGFENSRIEILAGLTRLRQICNHPGLINEKFIGIKDISGKMDLFNELIDECMQGDHRVLVFSQFVKMLGILKDQMNMKKIKYCYLDGQSRDREGIIRTFNNNSSTKVFLISLKAGGFGLNLTSADTVILYDPWWNPMVEEQASDRAHRIGQEKTVNVYRLITKGTVEEKMQKLKERKKLLFDSLVNESGDFMAKLSWEDLKEVLM